MVKLSPNTLEKAVGLMEVLQKETESMSTNDLRSVGDVLSLTLPLVRRAMNSRCPINRLSPELLVIIFQYTFDPFRFPAEMFVWPSASLKSNRVLADLAKVCSLWHDIIMGTHALWGHLAYHGTVRDPFYRLPMHHMPLDTILKRSRPAPLKVFLLMHSHSGTAHEIMPYDLSRLQELYVHCAGGTWDDYTDYPAPDLEQLTLHIEPGFDVTGRRNVLRRPHSLELFQGWAPRLRALSLETSTGLPVNTFPSLTHLHLSAPVVRAIALEDSEHLPDKGWTLPDLLHFLRGCPDLVEFVLMDADDATADEHADPRPVALPHMRRLVFGHARPRALAWLARRMALPSDVALRIFPLRRGGARFLPDFLPLLPLPPDLRVLVLQEEEDTSLVFSPPQLTLHAASARTGVRVESIIHKRDPAWTDAVWRLFALAQVRDLRVYDGSRRMQAYANVPALLRALPQLAHVAYHAAPDEDASLETFLAGLLPWPAAPALPCPALATLLVWVGASLEMLEVVVRFAALRAQCGAPLARIVVEHDHDLVERDLGELRNYVRSFEMRAASAPSRVPMSWPPVCTAAPHRYWPRWE